MTTATATTTADPPRALYASGVAAFAPIFELATEKKYRHFFMWGGRGGAKSMTMADFFAIRGRNDQGVFLCTREVQNSLEESSYNAIRSSVERIGIPNYYITDRGIFNKSGCKMIFVGLGYRKGVHVKSTSGIMRCWVEEAQQVSDDSLKVLIPTVRETGSKLYYTYNRTSAHDPVHDYFNTFRTKCQRVTAKIDGRTFRWKLHLGDGAVGIEINYDGNPYFPEALEGDRIHDYERAVREGDWDHYNHVWQGMPLLNSAESVITIREAMEASRRDPDYEGAVEIGADIARGGKDRVVFYKRKGLAVTERKIYANNSDAEMMRITETAERLESFANNDKSIRIKVDDTGLGGGVTDILHDHGFNVVPVNFASRAAENDRYTNVASELWFSFAQIIDTVTIPDEIGLIEEITQRKEGRRDSRGRRSIESKDDFVSRFGRSPDEADALLLAYYEPDNVVSEMDWAVY